MLHLHLLRSARLRSARLESPATPPLTAAVALALAVLETSSHLPQPHEAFPTNPLARGYWCSAPHTLWVWPLRRLPLEGSGAEWLNKIGDVTDATLTRVGDAMDATITTLETAAESTLRSLGMSDLMSAGLSDPLSSLLSEPSDDRRGRSSQRILSGRGAVRASRLHGY